MADITKNQEIVVSDSADLTQTAAVNSTEPAGTENGLYTRIVSQPSIRVRNPSGTAQDVGFRTTDMAVPIEFNPYYGLLDASSRMRTGQPTGLESVKQVYDQNSLNFTQSLSGSGSATYSTNTSSTTLAVTTLNGDAAIRQTRQYVPYEPGRSQLIYLSGVMGAIKSNVTQRIGLFDDNDGLFFEQNGTALQVVVRTSTSGSPVDTAVTQTSWNIDTLNGSGPSGITIDTSKIQLFIIDLTWLGAGRVRFGFSLNGKIIYCHQVIYSNSATAVYIKTPNLPLRWEIRNTGVTASSTSMSQICGAVFSEGGFDPKGVTVAYNTATTAIAVTTATPIIAIRLKSSHNRASVRPISFDAVTTSNKNMLMETYLGGTLTGGAWSSTSGMATEANISASTYSSVGATRIASNFISSGGSRSASSAFNSRLLLTSDYSGTSDVLVLVGTSIDGGTANTYASMTFQEIY